MSHEELRTAHERLKQQASQLLREHPATETENLALHKLLQDLQTLTDEYDRKVTELEAQVAELRRELFGPKSD
jgi:polyhydroxyalkanoate synthesis regulator phasin